MLVLIAYAIVIFTLCGLTIWLFRLKFSAFLAVGIWTALGPLLMQLLDLVVVGYVDPFWPWAATIQAGIALVASFASLGLCALLERDAETA